MVDGKLRAEWRQLSELCSLVANVNRDKKKRKKPYCWTDWFPFDVDAAAQPQSMEASMDQIINMFPGAKKAGATKTPSGETT